jgi:uncharacterized protein
MQSILNQIQGISVGQFSVVAGAGLLGVVFLQGLLFITSSVRRTFYERRTRELNRRKLELQVEAAKLQCEELEQKKFGWSGYRKFVVAKKVKECEDVYSFYLSAHDHKPLPSFKPGQYITFSINIPGLTKSLVRCYSLSDCPRPDYYRVTIKRALPPAELKEAPVGLVSSFFCDKIQEGQILDVKAPAGGFFLELAQERPIVLIAGGVGVTPMLSMLNALAQKRSTREVWFFFGLRNGAEHFEKERLAALARDFDNIRVQICYSRPSPNDMLGRDYHHAERVSVELLRRLLPSNNYDFYICGPGAMMKSITDDLKSWGVPEKNIFFEAFGPATVKKAAAPAALVSSAAALQVTFSRSGKIVKWDGSGSLLDLAEANGLQIEAGCRAGNCGSCAIAIKSGSVDLLAEHHGAPMEEGSCLACISRPKCDLVVEA